MKHHVFSFLLIWTAVVVTSGCKKDPVESRSLIGKWETVSEEKKQWENNTLIDESTYPYSKDELVAEFRTNNTITFTEFGVLRSDIITYSISGNVITIEGEESDFNLTNNSNTLTITDEEVEVSNGVTYRYEFTTTLKRL